MIASVLPAGRPSSVAVPLSVAVFSIWIVWLAPALTALVARAPVVVAVHDEVGERLPSPVELALYFTAAEAITNCVKHAQATAAEVRLCRQNGPVTMEVRDDGVGGASVDGSTGLRGLADRLDTIGGSLDVQSPPGAGTRLWVSVPWRRSPTSEPIAPVLDESWRTS